QIGVDIERIDQPELAQEVAERYFSKNEVAWIQSGPTDARTIRFTELWTLKEAFLKATGVGLSGSLSDVSFLIDEDARVSCSSPIVSADWHFALFKPFERVRLAVAISGVTRPHFIFDQDAGKTVEHRGECWKR